MAIIYHRDFSAYNYQVICELGRNQKAGRITYLAKNILTQQKVVIKEFNFDIGVAEWYITKTYKREIATLKKLDHPRIPRFLHSFETATGCYLVLEYKNAPSLGIKHSFHPEEIKKIAVSILEILVYLQQQDSPMIHRDIKPENILVDLELNVYLVDFGLTKLQNNKQELTTLITGTPGFIPPEEYLGHELTKASDLYSLGATLICLLTNTNTVNAVKLIDHHYRFHFDKLLSENLTSQFISWLKKMVEPSYKRRYANAADALQVLKTISVIDKPEQKNSLLAIFNQPKIMVFMGLATMGILAALGTSLNISKDSNFIKYNLNFQENLIDANMNK